MYLQNFSCAHAVFECSKQVQKVGPRIAGAIFNIAFVEGERLDRKGVLRAQELNKWLQCDDSELFTRHMYVGDAMRSLFLTC